MSQQSTYEQEILGAQQQKALAQKLRESAKTPDGQMVSGWYVAPSITQHLATLLQTYSGKKGMEEADQKIKDLQAGQAQKEQAYIAGMPSATVTPAVDARTAPVFEDSASRLANALTQGAQPNLSPTQANADAMQPNVIADALRTQSQQTLPVQTGTQQISAQPEKTTQPNIEDYLKYAMNAPNDRTAQLVQLLGVNRQNSVDKRDAAQSAADLKRETTTQQIEAKRQHDADMIAQSERESRRDAALRQSLASFAQANKPAQPDKSDQWKYDSGSDTWVQPPNAQFPQGRSTQPAGKIAAVQNFDSLAKELLGDDTHKGLIDKVQSGGFMGIKGVLAGATDKDNADNFNNIRESMSAEYRKIFRIPGEGALSDNEQAQYGVQLPNIKNNPSVNKAIVMRGAERARNALQLGNNPISGQGGTVSTGQIKPASGAKFLGFE
jgi:hypothetical protein